MYKIFIILAICICSGASTSMATGMSWNEAKKNKNATINIHFRTNDPFLMITNSGQYTGLEYEMLIGFQQYLKNKYDINLSLNWQLKDNFLEIINQISNRSNVNDIGLGIISKTAERGQSIDFSNAYFPDIQVLISGRGIPTVSNIDDFKLYFESCTAITVAGTTYEKKLREIRESQVLGYRIEYIHNSDEIITGILKRKNNFGYIDLSGYIMALENGYPIKRHNIFPVKGEGFCIALSKGSDWNIAINEYLNSNEFATLKETGLRKYLGNDVEHIIAQISSGDDEEIILLQKEKDLINNELSEKEKIVEQQTYIRNILIVTIVLALLVVYFLFNRNRVKTTANEILMLHRKMMENQNILLTDRNQELISLNEEKNNFIHILSHDLRAPINNITGLSKILTMDEATFTEDQLRIIEHIGAESRRLNKMVTRILDIEKIEKRKPEEYHEIILCDVLRRVIINYEEHALRKNIRIEFTPIEGIKVMGLDQFFFHVFENLLSNAIKFSPTGSEVYIEMGEESEDVFVKVIDHGPGLTEDDKKNMFKKFQMLSAKATGGERSTGLGLSIVNKYVKLLRGELVCDSIVGKGTVFSVKLKKIT